MEEDIKILENKLKQWEPYKNIKFSTEIEKEISRENKAIENLINRNKELEEENKRLNKLDLSNNKLIANMSERHFYDSEKIRNSIPTSKVEEKIYKTKFYIPEYQGEFIAIEDLEELLEKGK